MWLPRKLDTAVRLEVEATLCSIWLLVGWPALASAQRPDTGRAGATFVPLAQPDTGPPVGPRLPMATVIARTLAHSPVYDTASGTVRTSRSFERVALGQFLPTVTASALAARSDQTFGSVTTATPSGPRGAYGGGLLATLPLFTGGFRGAVRREAAALARAANAGLVLNRFATRFTAKQGYYAVLYAHELVRVGHDAVTVNSKGLSYTKTQRAAGTVTPVDVFQAQLALTQAQYQLLAALDTLTSNAAELGRLVGSDGPVDAEPLDNLDPTPLAMDDSAIVQAALRDAPAVQQTEAQVAATQASVRAAKAQYSPIITASTGYNWSNGGLIIGAPRQGWLVQVAAALPLFNGFVREDSVIRTDVSANEAAVTAADTRRQNGALARQFLASLHTAEQNVALQKEAVRVATENLRLTSVQYQAGITTVLQLLTAQQSLIQVELTLVSARFAYQIARASLEAVLGREL